MALITSKSLVSFCIVGLGGGLGFLGNAGLALTGGLAALLTSWFVKTGLVGTSGLVKNTFRGATYRKIKKYC